MTSFLAYFEGKNLVDIASTLTPLNMRQMRYMMRDVIRKKGERQKDKMGGNTIEENDV